MGKIILQLAVSLDGFIEGPNGAYDWCFVDQDYGMRDFLKSIDAIFFGRKSYEMMLSTGGDTLNQWADKKHFVFSRTLPPSEAFELIRENVFDEVQHIKQISAKNIWLFGGAALTTSLINEGLVDVLALAVHPILLGSGKPLFSGLQKRIKTQLKNTTTFNTGLVMLNYNVLN